MLFVTLQRKYRNLEVWPQLLLWALVKKREVMDVSAVKIVC